MQHSQSAFTLDDRKVVIGLLRIADVLIVALAGIAAYWIRHRDVVLPDHYVVAIAVAVLLTANYMQIARLYEFNRLQQFTLQFGTLVASWGAAVLTLLALAYFGKITENYSRVWSISWFTVSFFGFIILRGSLSLMLFRWSNQGRLTFNIVVVGADDLGRRLIKHLDNRKSPGVRVVGLFDDRKTRIPDTLEGHRVLGTVNDVLGFVRDNQVDQIIIALPWRAGGHLAEILQKLRNVAVDVKLCPEAIAFDLPNLGYGDLAGVPMLGIFERPLTGWNTVAKNVEDRILAIILLLVGWPILLVIALLIKFTSRGPVLFRQPRYGFNNNEFTVLKFRTM